MGVLRLRLLGFPVQVQPGFWILALLVSTYGQGWQRSLALLLVVASSILAHELGHALAARRYGQEPHISLHMMGGLTSWVPTRELGRTRSMIVTLAGPAGGLALGIVALLVTLFGPAVERDSLAPLSVLFWGLHQLYVVNFFWSAINLLPVLPFDGGQLLALALGKRRRRLAAQLSLGFGLVCAAAMWSMGWPIAAVVFGFGGLTNYLVTERQLAAASSTPKSTFEEILRRTRVELDAGRLAEALTLARAVASASSDPDQQRRATELMGWAGLLSGDVHGARASIAESADPEGVDALLRAAVEEAEGGFASAAATLERAAAAGDRRPEVTAARVRLLLMTGRLEQAARLTTENIEEIELSDARRVAEQTAEGGASAAAAALWRAIAEASSRPEDALNAARQYARAGDRDAALVELRRCVAAGYDGAAALARDPDFSSWRDDPQLRAVLGAAAPS